MNKPTYEELEKRVKEFERAEAEHKKTELALAKKQEKLIVMLKHKVLLANIASYLNKVGSFDNIIDELLKKIALMARIDSVCLFGTDSQLNEGQLLGIWARNADHLKHDPEHTVYFSQVPRLISRIKQGRNFFFSNVSELKGEEREFFKNRNIGAGFILPIRIGDQIRGILCFHQEHKYVWESGSQNLLKAIADIISNVWERDNHFKALLEAEKKRTEAVQVAEKALRLASTGALAAGIAHEINQPLNALSMAVNGMLYWKKKKSDVSKEEIFRKLGFISKQTARIDEIIMQMRVLARQEKGAELLPVDINTTIENALFLIGQQLTAHGIEVVKKLDDLLPLVRGNATQLEQVIINLVVNAMNALDTVLKKDKKIFISTGSNKDHCIIKVKDNGPGIPEENLVKIFNPFFTTKEKGKGMGFGLSIAHNIISEHGGTIAAENSEEGGAQFTILMPISSNNNGM